MNFVSLPTNQQQQVRYFYERRAYNGSGFVPDRRAKSNARQFGGFDIRTDGEIRRSVGRFRRTRLH